MQSVLLGRIGATKYIPVLYFALAGMINLVVGIYRAKAAIYRESDLEMVSALPLGGKSIVASRVFRMYFDNLIVGLAVIIQSMLIYGIRTGCGILFYI
jgi:ABC-2 type transport system permease protein